MIGVLLILFSLISVMIVYKNIDIATTKTNYDELNLCNEIGMLVSNSFAQGLKNQILFNANKDVSIIGSEIRVGNNYCSFTGIANDVDLTAGLIRIKNIDGVVVVENV